MDTLTKLSIGTQAFVKITVVAVQSSTAAHARQQPKRIPEITVFTMAGTADVNIACCITNVYHFSLFHDNKILTLARGYPAGAQNNPQTDPNGLSAD